MANAPDPESKTVIIYPKDDDPAETITSVTRDDCGPDETMQTDVDGESRTVALGENKGTKSPDSDEIPLQDCNDSYKLKKMLGQGGQGEVFEAVHKNLNRVVAIKRVKNLKDAKLNFFREAYTTARLDHPNIVPIHDIGLIAGDDGNSPMLVMKKIEGRSWSDLIKEDRDTFDSYEAFLNKHLRIFIDVCDAVRYAHSKGIIHRDLKPQQVMVGNFGEVLLLDWGLAVYLGEPENAPDPMESQRIIPPKKQVEDFDPDSIDTGKFLTLESATCPAGTPHYMAPEQSYFEPDRLGFFTDVYLLGGILYLLVVGHPPRRPKSARTGLFQARENEFEPLPEWTPEQLKDVILHCLETDPADRPSDIREIKDAVDGYLTGNTKRANSRKITEKLLTREPGNTYSELSDYARELSTATHEWPDNPDLNDLREQLYHRYALVAVEQGDLALAQLQTERIDNEDTRESLREEISNAKQKLVEELPRIPLFNLKRIAFCVLISFVIAASIISVYLSAQKSVMEEVTDKVESLATLAAQDIDPSDLEVISETPDIYLPEFQNVLSRLNYFRRANQDIRYIFTLEPQFTVDDQSMWKVLVDADPLDVDMDGDGRISSVEKGNPPGGIYDDGTDAMAHAFEYKEATSSIIEDDWGRFFGGYAPVVDPETDEVKALLTILIRFEDLGQKLFQIQLFSAIAFVLLLLIVWSAAAGIFAVQRSLKQVELLQARIRKQGESIRGGNFYIG